MRIDEFSAPAQIDGSLSTVEITRFLTFGFDITISELVTEVISKIFGGSHLVKQICADGAFEKTIQGGSDFIKQVEGEGKI